MTNTHLISTDKPSRIYLIKKNNKLGITSADPEFTENFGSGTQNQYIYITSDEEINANTKPCWCINTIKNTWDKDVIYYQGSMPQYHFIGFKKIVLTTDQKLIDDGIQSIDDEFLEWFVKNQSCEEVEVQCRYNFYVGQDLTHYKIIIPKEEPNYNMKEEILDEMKRPNQYSKPLEGVRTENYHPSDYTNNQYVDDLNTYIDYLELQKERTYSDEDMRSAWEDGRKFEHDINGGEGGEFTGAESFTEWFEPVKKK